jgi:protein-S-isoprenylcysteine O-methyltransferase Ste14
LLLREMSLDSVLRYFLPCYLVIYFATAFIWRSYRTWKSTGLNPYTLGASDNAHDFVGRLFRLIFFACLAVVGLYAFWPAGYQYLAPVTWLQRSALVYMGLGLLVFSLIWILLAQAQMGAAWRIGIDTSHTTELVQRGVFLVSRNPIFLGMRLTLLGLFLVIPSAATLAILALGDALIQIQVRLEEEFLDKKHCEVYRRYRRQVRRWL